MQNKGNNRIRMPLNIVLLLWLQCFAIFGWAKEAPLKEPPLLVSGATSLTNVLPEIGALFTQKYPGTVLEFNFGASGVLLQQMMQGAPVDIFVSADVLTMDKAAEKNLIDPSTRLDWATNQLVLIIPKKNNQQVSPVQWTGLADLTAEQVHYIAMGQPDTTPNARYAKAVLDQAGIWESIKKKLVFSANVRQSLDYVRRAEVDAGFVFATDALQSKDYVQVVLTIPTVQFINGDWQPQPIVYPAARVQTSQHPQALLFLSFLRSAEVIPILTRYGFGVPVGSQPEPQKTP